MVVINDDINDDQLKLLKKIWFVSFDWKRPKVFGIFLDSVTKNGRKYQKSLPVNKKNLLR